MNVEALPPLPVQGKEGFPSMRPLVARLTGPQGWRAWAIAALLGAASAAALPPLHVIPVLLFTVPALLALIGTRPTRRAAAAIGFWFGFGHHLFGLYWMTEAILVEAAKFWWLVPFAVPMTAAVLAVFTAGPCAVAWGARPGLQRLLALAGAWTLFDLAKQFVATGFPWNAWGTVWAVPGWFGDVFLQPAAYVGVHGLTLATVLLAGLPILGRRGLIAGGVGLAAWAGIGVVRLNTAAVIPVPDLSVVLVQGNVPQGQKIDRYFAIDTFRRYLALSHQGVVQSAGHPAVVIWPETASPFWLAEQPAARAAISEATDGDPALIGTIRFDDERQPRNSLIAITGQGAIAATYDKWHLVPFGEYVPTWLPLPIQVVPGNGLAMGPGPRTLDVPGLPAFAPLICYEAIFTGQIVAAGPRPDWLVNITNDAWFGNSTGPRQHLAAARLRAVEEGLPLMRAANTGISAAYDAFGHELGRLAMQTSGTLVVKLPGHLATTPYAKNGLFIPLVLGAIVLSFGRPRLRRSVGAIS